MDISTLERAYREKTMTPTSIVRETYMTLRSQGERPVWITVVSEAESLKRAEDLERVEDRSKLPLFGIPFAVKDNFNVAGLPTTAACPAFSWTPDTSAEAVQRLLGAGAILIGKTNMDQFATGLVGTRTPYGTCSSVFDSESISGGSSSGSAVAVASGAVSFSLGTDTAGSGRVPAAFNQIVGVKPTRGIVSTHGVLPACRTLDCVSVFAETCLDAARVLAVIQGEDRKDPFSRGPRPGQSAAPWLASTFRFGVLAEGSQEFFGDEQSKTLYNGAIEAMSALGGEAVVCDYGLFAKAASLLYEGPWVAERLAAIQEFFESKQSEMDVTVAGILCGASRFNAIDTFKAEYALKTVKADVDQLFQKFDFLLLPTAPTTYTIAEVQQTPVVLNSNLGYYTNFVNLLDLAAVAIPGGMKDNGLPFGVSLIGQAFSDQALLAMADQLHRRLSTTIGGSSRFLASTPELASGDTPPGCVLMAVVGAHLTGQPLNGQLVARKARLVRTVRSHGGYRLYALPNSVPPKPGLVFDPGYAGQGVELEIWAMPEDTVGSFLAAIPAPLSLGTIRLEDGTSVKGFLCEPAGIQGAEDITTLGGWRNYLRAR